MFHCLVNKLSLSLSLLSVSRCTTDESLEKIHQPIPQISRKQHPGWTHQMHPSNWFIPVRTWEHLKVKVNLSNNYTIDDTFHFSQKTQAFWQPSSHPSAWLIYLMSIKNYHHHIIDSCYGAPQPWLWGSIHYIAENSINRDWPQNANK